MHRCCCRRQFAILQPNPSRPDRHFSQEMTAMYDEHERFHEETDRDLERRVTAFLADRNLPGAAPLGRPVAPRSGHAPRPGAHVLREATGWPVRPPRGGRDRRDRRDSGRVRRSLLSAHHGRQRAASLIVSSNIDRPSFAASGLGGPSSDFISPQGTSRRHGPRLRPVAEVRGNELPFRMFVVFVLGDGSVGRTARSTCRNIHVLL